MKTLLLFMLMAVLMGLVLSVFYISYLLFLARRSRKALNSNESFIELQVNKI